MKLKPSVFDSFRLQNYMYSYILHCISGCFDNLCCNVTGDITRLDDIMRDGNFDQDKKAALKPSAVYETV